MARPRRDLTNKQFGRLRVLRPAPDVPAPSRARTAWYCRCSCGVEFVAITSNLSNGGTRACGICSRKRKNFGGLQRGRRFVAALALLAGATQAGPFVLSDPLPTTHCGFRLNAIPVIDVPLIGGVCRIDFSKIPGLADGVHTVTLTSVNLGPPRQESARTTVFYVNKLQNGTVWQGWTNIACTPACSYQ